MTDKHVPKNAYLLSFLDQTIPPRVVIADYFEHDAGLVVFCVSLPDEVVPVVAVNARALVEFTIEGYAGTGVEDPGPSLYESSDGWDERLVSPNNPYVRSLHMEPPKQEPNTVSDPFRGGKLKENKP